MAFLYKTRGTCSRNIILEMDGDIIKDVEFIGGCDGNLKGIRSLVRGQRAAARRLPVTSPDYLSGLSLIRIRVWS